MADQSPKSQGAGSSSEERLARMDAELFGPQYKNLKPGQVVDVSGRFLGQGFQVLGLKKPKSSDQSPKQPQQ